eukprot:scaffold34999_cov34-Phaeocystis_antarctica.AAC.1
MAQTLGTGEVAVWHAAARHGLPGRPASNGQVPSLACSARRLCRLLHASMPQLLDEMSLTSVPYDRTWRSRYGTPGTKPWPILQKTSWCR